MEESLRGATVVVVGGSSGIGLATATLAHQRGAQVIIAARDGDRLKTARDAIGGDTEARALDVADEDEVRALFTSIERVDHVVTLAGAAAAGRITDTDTAALRRALDVRFWGSLYVAKYAVPRMPDTGSITFSSGVIVERPAAGRTLGTVATASVEAFARALAVEVAPIRVNAIRPGTVDTPMTQRILGDRREEALAAEAARLPAGRIGQPEDLADAICFLMQNPYVTGITLTVDGGRLLV